MMSYTYYLDLQTWCTAAPGLGMNLKIFRVLHSAGAPNEVVILTENHALRRSPYAAALDWHPIRWDSTIDSLQYAMAYNPAGWPSLDLCIEYVLTGEHQALNDDHRNNLRQWLLELI